MRRREQVIVGRRFPSSDELAELAAIRTELRARDQPRRKGNLATAWHAWKEWRRMPRR